MPNKLLGQIFLNSGAVIQKIITTINVQSSDEIIEIGSGSGALTIPLLKKCGDVGVMLLAIEKDAKLAEELRVVCAGQGIKNLEIITGDALAILTPRLQHLNPHLKIVGNIPYYLTGHLLRIISESENRPARCVFMVQKEVAERMVAEPPDMNRLAASVQYWAEPKIATYVSKKDFIPQPKVDSALVILEKRAQPVFPNAGRYFAIMRAVFAQPRKTILNNLASRDIGAMSIKRGDISQKLNTISINPLDRPQNLSIVQIAAIADCFFE